MELPDLGSVFLSMSVSRLSFLLLLPVCRGGNLNAEVPREDVLYGLFTIRGLVDGRCHSCHLGETLF